MARSTPRTIGRFAISALLAISLLPAASAGPKGKRPPKPPPAQSSFTDHFQYADTVRWSAADGWSNGSPFDNAWSADHVVIQDGRMTLRLDDQAQLGEPYTSGEYRTLGFYGYGCFEASMKPVPNPGAVSAFFTFAGPWDNGGNGRHNEIDIEFPGTTDSVQFNFWTNDDDFSSRNEYLHPLTFNAADAFHTYAFKWTASGIRWYIDGDLIYEVLDTALNPTPKASESLHKIMMNLWAVDASAANWAGTFEYPGSPVEAQFDWVRYTEGEDCQMQPAPEEPPPPTGGADTISIIDVQLTLNSRATQVIARVMVRDGTGNTVENAQVTGAWSGVIDKGDGVRSTDAQGVATFYSGRTRAAGEVQFCVTDAMLAGYTYEPDANLVTCGAVTK